ncbi:hypothetical protein PanWU01x14_143230, partial [Parasponia andersonii]
AMTSIHYAPPKTYLCNLSNFLNKQVYNAKSNIKFCHYNIFLVMTKILSQICTYIPEEVWAKGTRPERPKTQYKRLTSELLPEPEKPTKRIVTTGGISVLSLSTPPVGIQKSPD